MFNGCTSSLKIYGECTGRGQDLLDASFRLNSPNYDLNSPLNPFVLHGDNLCIVLEQNGYSNDNLIGLQNNSSSCIKYEWEDFKVSAFTCEIGVEPKLGHLKPGHTKLFRVSVKSLGNCVQLQTIPIRCKVFRHRKGNEREYSLPDGYFEFTERGYYEKVSCAKHSMQPYCMQCNKIIAQPQSQFIFLTWNIKARRKSSSVSISSRQIGLQTASHFCNQCSWM